MRRTNKIIIASLSVAAVFIALYGMNVIMTPSWLFEITTDKPVYNLGENVQITVTLKNKGYVSHSFTAAVDNPVVVSIESVSPSNPVARYQVWYTPFQEGETTFTVSSNQALTRMYTWNQTNIQVPQFWNNTYEPGTYLIEAFIPKLEKGFFISDNDVLFLAWVYINVTAAT